MKIKDINGVWVCQDCGTQYMKEIGREIVDDAVTSHHGNCCACSDRKTVVHIRNYGWLYKWFEESKKQK
jgi:hypothetical protein